MAQATTSLQHRGDPLANPEKQLVALTPANSCPPFSDTVRLRCGSELTADYVEILQVNVGKLCNMTCAHCHVDAGPDRREIMSRTTMVACLDVLRKTPSIRTLDLTGGAPEMNPHFREFVSEARALDRHVIDRCNLTILMAKGFEDLSQFLAAQRVEIVASLPCYLEENTDSQRGSGAFSDSVVALRRLNALGYGIPGSGLTLTLVYNPVDAQLPPNQPQLEAAYRQELAERYGIQFDRLFTITNMPISRYLEYLLVSRKFDQYMQTLVDAFNPAAVDGLMCKNTLSVSWDGRLFDCDFNQMLNLGLDANCPASVYDFDATAFQGRRIAVGQHCYGCTAGAGSGCQGAIAGS